jgi:hypothetical protein
VTPAVFIELKGLFDGSMVVEEAGDIGIGDSCDFEKRALWGDCGKLLPPSITRPSLRDFRNSPRT